jgi:hopanoid biosynthesis associated radical SAM protein HpnJ
MLRTLFLQAPSFDGFDGGAGARYQMKREVRSFWFPTWLAQPAAMVEGSKLIDAPPHGQTMADVLPEVRERDLVVMHTSTPSFKSDVLTAERLKAENPGLKIGFIGAKVAVEPEKSLRATTAIDFVARNEFDFTIKEAAEDRPFADIKGISYRNKEGVIVHNEDREILENMDSLPWVTPIYKRDLVIEKYFGGYLKHPYISFYTGRGCKSRCTFCLWPQTVGGHRYRVRSIEDVVEEVKWAKAAMPQVKEFFFDDDTLTDNLPRVEALAKELGKIGVVWSCNAKANVPRKTLEILKANGLRLLLVGYESGNQKILHNIKKGLLVEVARRFTKDCHDLGIVIHGTFILGLPGETKETIQETLEFAKRINPHTIQISLAAPYPGTFLYKQAKENGWLYNEEIDLLTGEGTQIAPLNYPHLSHTEIFNSVEEFYRKFYFRPSKIASIMAEMIVSPEMMKRRLREGVEFFQFLRQREDAAA